MRRNGVAATCVVSRTQRRPKSRAGRLLDQPAAFVHSAFQVSITLLEACRNRFGQGSAGIVVVQRPHVGSAKLVLLDVGRLRCYRRGIVVAIESSGGRIVEGRSDSGRIVPGGVSVLIREVLNGRVGRKSRSQHGVATVRSSG